MFCNIFTNEHVERLMGASFVICGEISFLSKHNCNIRMDIHSLQLFCSWTVITSLTTLPHMSSDIPNQQRYYRRTSNSIVDCFTLKEVHLWIRLWMRKPSTYPLMVFRKYEIIEYHLIIHNSVNRQKTLQTQIN
jgi:hypothetical protein